MKHNDLQANYWNKESKRIAHIEITEQATREIDNFFKFVGLQSNMKILDVGCGGGRLTLPLLRLGHNIIGTEVADENFNEIRGLIEKENLKNNLILLKTDLSDPLIEKEFDLAILCNVIHHFDPEKKVRIMKNIATALKPGGQIAIIEPNPFCPLYYPWYFLKEVTGQDRGRWQVEKNFLDSTPAKLTALLNDANFKNIEMARYAVIPSRLTITKSIVWFNDLLLKTPLIKNMSAFIWFKARKSDL